MANERRCNNFYSRTRYVRGIVWCTGDKISFDHANELMQGATSFAPRVVQTMLEQCSSVKCKRLFLLLAERHSHQWISPIDRSKIDLGVGNRMLVKGGMLDKKYRITVPKIIQLKGISFKKYQLTLSSAHCVLRKFPSACKPVLLIHQAICF